MYLNATNLNLQAVLAGAVATSQPECHVFYRVWNNKGTESKPSTYRSALNSASDVNILAAPTVQGTAFEIDNLTIYNKDTAAVTVTVKTDDGTTERIIVKHTLNADETLGYSTKLGWYVL